jgi:hypothetical protein
MSGRLRDTAIQAFGKAANKAYLAATTKDPVQLARSVSSLADGLVGFAAGLPLHQCLHVLLVIAKMLQRQPLSAG